MSSFGKCEWRAIVTEFARAGLCDAKVQAHVVRCVECAEWLESQRALASALRRFGASNDDARADAGVERAVLAAFDHERAERARTTLRRRAAIAAGLTAAVLLGTAGELVRGKLVGPPEPSPVVTATATEVTLPEAKAEGAAPRLTQAAGVKKQPVKRTETRDTAQVDARHANGPAQEPFVAIPYTLPLAAGERAWVVRMQMPVAALVSTGVPLAGRAGDPAPVETDVVVGEDGRARAIRVVSAVLASR